MHWPALLSCPRSVCTSPTPRPRRPEHQQSTSPRPRVLGAQGLPATNKTEEILEQSRVHKTPSKPVWFFQELKHPLIDELDHRRTTLSHHVKDKKSCKSGPRRRLLCSRSPSCPD
ncbi:uncharacterized protein ACOB8E_023432 [Sarcophilus harrisii]